MRTTILIFLISINIFCFSQVKTEAYFGVAGRNDATSNILELYDKGYYISGGFDIGNYVYNGWNIKTDVNLEMVYDKVLEHNLSTVAISNSTSDINGNIYVCGFMEIVDKWPFVTKVDSCGNKVWCKVLKYEDEFEDGWGLDILYNENNEVILLANFDSEEEIEKLHLVGLSTNGDVMWKKPYATKDDHPWIQEQNAFSITEINNEYYISGYCYWPYPSDTTHVFLRPLFIGIDSLFEEKWILPFAAMDSVFGDAYKTIPLNDSVFMGVGVRYGFYQGLLMFYNKDGEELGYYGIEDEQIGPNVNGSDIRDIAKINDTLFLAAAFFGSENTGNPGGEFKVSVNGGIYGANSRPGTHFPNIVKSSDNNFVIATTIEESKGDDDIYVYKIDENLNDVPFDPTPHNYDSLCPGGIQSGTTDLTDCFIWTDIGEAPSPSEFYASVKKIPVAVYPNPSKSGQVNFTFENTKYHYNMELRCFNVIGEVVYIEKVYRQQEESSVKTTTWQKGMYIAVVYSNGLPVGQCKFVVQ